MQLFQQKSVANLLEMFDGWWTDGKWLSGDPQSGQSVFGGDPTALPINSYFNFVTGQTEGKLLAVWVVVFTGQSFVYLKLIV